MKKILLIIISILAICSCARFEQMNVNRNQLQSALAPSFIQPALFSYEYNLTNYSKSFNGQIIQYVTSYSSVADKVGNYRVLPSVYNGLWNSFYVVAGNTEIMRKRAEEDGDVFSLAVANILRVMVMSTITDTYGDVPYFDALKAYTEQVYNSKYDSQKAIYIDFFSLLELANDYLSTAKEKNNLEASNDYMYGGDLAKWRKLCNSFYLRLLMRCALKDVECGNELGIVAKINEIYSNPEKYPIFTNAEEAANVGFSEDVTALHTPFYEMHSGNWEMDYICTTLYNMMRDKSTGLADPRIPVYFDSSSKGACPPQLTIAQMNEYTDIVAHLNKGLKTRDHYAIMNYSEILFIWSECAARGWIPGSAMGYYEKAVGASVREWVPTATDAVIANLLSNSRVSVVGLDGEELIERIMEQKYVSNFMNGIEAWCDYRRTGYPKQTTTSLAGNDGKVPTRLKYPADEVFRNPTYYPQALEWLGGTDNMLTEVWWADHQSKRK